MATTVAENPIMVAVTDGDQRNKLVPEGIVGESYKVAPVKSVDLLQPGQPLGDGTPALGDFPDFDGDEMLTGVIEGGIIARPAFPREASNFQSAHQTEFSTLPRVGYTQRAPKYYNVIFPDPVDDDGTGIPDDVDEFYSVSASDGVHYTSKQPAEDAQNADLAHQANLIMSDTEQSATGATGVWSIAGRV